MCVLGFVRIVLCYVMPLFPCEESFLWPQLLDLTGLKICRGLKYAHQVFSEYLLILARLLIRDISEFLDNSQNFVSCFVFLSSTCMCIGTTIRCHFLVLNQLDFFSSKKTWQVVSLLRWHDPTFQQINKWQQNSNIWVHFAVVSQRRYTFQMCPKRSHPIR